MTSTVTGRGRRSPRPVLMVRAFRSLLRQLDEQEVWAIK